MALARVQGTPRTTSASASSISFTFTTPPTVGNGLVVFTHNDLSAGAVTPTCADNKGNTYLLAATKLNGRVGASIFYCPRLVAAGASFTVTLSSSAAMFWIAQAVEVSGVGPGLIIDQSVTASGTSTAPATGATAALTAAETFQAACHGIAAAQASITVGVVSPVWTQEYEELPFSFSAGESDTRVNSASAGTTPSASWTDTASAVWAACLVAFAVGTAGATSARVSQDAVELLSQPTSVAARVSQDVVETLSQPTPAARVSQHVVEILGATVGTSTAAQVTQQVIELLSQTPPTPVQVTQSLVEVLAQSPPLGTRLTQLAVEVFETQTAHARTTQLALEVLLPITIPTRVTQTAVEVYRAEAGRIRLTQEAVELFVFVPPCTNGSFPIDPGPTPPARRRRR